jgi:hypothetical protein
LLAFVGFASALLDAAKSFVPRRLILAFALGIGALPLVQVEAPYFMADVLLALGILVAAVSILRAPGSVETALWIATLPLIKIDGIAIGALMLAVNAAAARGHRERTIVASVAFGAAAVAPWLLVFVTQHFNPFVVEDRGVIAHAFGPRDAIESPAELARRLGEAAAGIFAFYVPHLTGLGLTRDAILQDFPFGGILVVFLGIPWMRPSAPPVASRPTRLLAGLAIVAGQIVGIAATPHTVAWQLGAVAGRAALHIVPGILLISSAASRRGGSD